MFAKVAALVALGWVPAGVGAQEVVGKFHWQAGQVLQYKVTHRTLAADTGAGGRHELESQVEQVKRWQVLDVDAAGVATVQLTLTRIKMHQRVPGGEVLGFDSDRPEQAHPQLRAQLAPLLNKPLVTLRVDPYGRVAEVKSAQQEQVNRYQSELPFTVILPGVALEAGQQWKRDYRIVLDPPLGTGEVYSAEQVYAVRSAGNGRATIAFGTTIKDLPPDPSDRIPLLQFQPRGEVVFDAQTGCIVSARVVSSGVVEGHGGEGSRYEFRTEYTEELVR
jgi:hypothetical protein